MNHLPPSNAAASVESWQQMITLFLDSQRCFASGAVNHKQKAGDDRLCYTKIRQDFGSNDIATID
eukprot:scaffold28551_cov38-Prasinocladus_malaysianus.AAC.1